MSSKNIKGITIELGGDVSGLNKAIKSVSSEARDTQSELKKIEKLLKLDPTNVTLLEQKQQLLNQSISKTEDVLTAMKDAKAKADADMADGTEINEKQYRELERQIIATEQSLASMTEEAENTGSKAGAAADKIKEKFASVASVVGDTVVGTAKAAAGALTAVAAGVTALVKESVEQYAEYEQLVGGVETLFGDSADKVQQYASSAYKAAGLSANEYMETVTSFSASLISSLGGNTAEAAEVANQAIVDMSDNANKMGTDMESIQNAYQGFAKQNYTMLDNLKLGYGGTKEEMERLIEDANRVKVANGEMADLSIDSFADIVEAIHIVQTEMGITGTTAEEAEKTISGSIAMTKAAWSNLVTGIADENADFEQLVNDFVESVGVTAENIIPRIQVALEGAGQLVETMIPIIVDMIPMIVGDMLPNILESGVSIIETLLQGIMDNGALIAQTAVNVVLTLLQCLLNMLPDLLVAGAMMLGEIAIGILEAIPEFLQQLPAIIEAIIATFTANKDTFIEIGKSILSLIWEGICSLWSAFISNFSGLLSGLNAAGTYQITGSIPMMASGGTLYSGSAIVGEAGPELLTVTGGKAVVEPLTGGGANTSKIEDLLTGISGQLGFGSDVPIVVEVLLDGDVVGRKALNYSRRVARANG